MWPMVGLQIKPGCLGLPTALHHGAYCPFLSFFYWIESGRTKAEATEAIK